MNQPIQASPPIPGNLVTEELRNGPNNQVSVNARQEIQSATPAEIAAREARIQEIILAAQSPQQARVKTPVTTAILQTIKPSNLLGSAREFLGGLVTGTGIRKPIEGTFESFKGVGEPVGEKKFGFGLLTGLGGVIREEDVRFRGRTRSEVLKQLEKEEGIQQYSGIPVETIASRVSTDIRQELGPSLQARINRGEITVEEAQKEFETVATPIFEERLNEIIRKRERIEKIVGDVGKTTGEQFVKRAGVIGETAVSIGGFAIAPAPTGAIFVGKSTEEFGKAIRGTQLTPQERITAGVTGGLELGTGLLGVSSALGPRGRIPREVTFETLKDLQKQQLTIDPRLSKEITKSKEFVGTQIFARRQVPEAQQQLFLRGLQQRSTGRAIETGVVRTQFTDFGTGKQITSIDPFISTGRALRGGIQPQIISTSRGEFLGAAQVSPKDITITQTPPGLQTFRTRGQVTQVPSKEISFFRGLGAAKKTKIPVTFQGFQGTGVTIGVPGTQVFGTDVTGRIIISGPVRTIPTQEEAASIGGRLAKSFFPTTTGFPSTSTGQGLSQFLQTTTQAASIGAQTARTTTGTLAASQVSTAQTPFIPAVAQLFRPPQQQQRRREQPLLTTSFAQPPAITEPIITPTPEPITPTTRTTSITQTTPLLQEPSITPLITTTTTQARTITPRTSQVQLITPGIALTQESAQRQRTRLATLQKPRIDSVAKNREDLLLSAGQKLGLRTKQLQALKNAFRTRLGSEQLRVRNPTAKVPLTPVIAPPRAGVQPLLNKIRTVVGENEGMNVVVGKGKKKVVVARNLPPNKAYRTGLDLIANEVTASFKLKPSNKVTRKKDIPPLGLGTMFRLGKNDPLRIVEKRKYRIDTRLEKQQLKARRKK